MSEGLPKLSLNSTAKTALIRGAPWVFSNQIVMSAAARALPPGSLVKLTEPQGRIIGLYHFNPHSLIAARLLSRNHDRAIDSAFFAERIARALKLRERVIGGVYYRLVHAEGDALPGLVIDRYDDTVIIQPNTAGMDTQIDAIVAAIRRVLAPERIGIAADGRARGLEGLEPIANWVLGEVKDTLPDQINVQENGLHYFADPLGGQKTGWFYDHRANRATMAKLTRNLRVLDLYSYTGGFALACLAGGATAVVSVDRSAPALALATKAAAANGVADRWRGESAEIFAWLETNEDKYDVVMADPPAFAKAKRDVPAALKGYEKLAKMATQSVAPGGFLSIASCSHHIEEAAFLTATAAGIRAGGRAASLIHRSGADADHPIHPLLPQTAYLKFLVYALD